MVKTISKYLWKEVAQFFIIIVSILILVSLIGNLLKLMDILVNKGGELIVLLKLVLFSMSFLLIYVIPISHLLAVLIVLNRLSGDREIIALKASGISILNLTRPILVFTVLPFILTLLLTTIAFPWGYKNFKNILYEVASKGGWSIREKTFNDDFEGLIIYANKVSPSGRTLEDIFISDEREENSPKIVVSNKGLILLNEDSFKVVLKLQNGKIYSMIKNEVLRELTFSNYQMSLEHSSIRKSTPQSRSNRELTISELNQKIKMFEKRGKNPAPYKIDLHKRFVIAFAPFVFTLIAIPLGTHHRRGGGLRGFIIGLIIMLSYYLFSTFMEFLGEEGGVVNPVLSVWSSNIIVAGFGCYLMYASYYESYNRVLGMIEEKVYGVLSYINNTFFGSH